jgi:hypothetical protein
MGGRHGPSAVAETAEGRSRGNGQGWWGAAIRWGAAIGARAGDCGHPTFGTGLKNFPTRCFWLGNTVADATVDDSPTVAGRDSRDGPTVRRPPSRSGEAAVPVSGWSHLEDWGPASRQSVSAPERQSGPIGRADRCRRRRSGLTRSPATRRPRDARPPRWVRRRCRSRSSQGRVTTAVVSPSNS